MNDSILKIEADNLSAAWIRLFDAADHNPKGEVCSATVNFSGLQSGVPEEDDHMRRAIDSALSDAGKAEVETVADTIFPISLWQICHGDRQVLYDMYLDNLPDYVSMAPLLNRKGTYFSRLIAYSINPKTGEYDPSIPEAERIKSNQLEFIIDHCKPKKRRSYLQAAIYDPRRDQVPDARQAFPCLQHVTFVPDFTNRTLSMNAFYATQQVFEKAYGNFLGLARLGIFVADQSSLKMLQVCCFIGIEKIIRPPRAIMGSLRREVINY